MLLTDEDRRFPGLTRGVFTATSFLSYGLQYLFSAIMIPLGIILVFLRASYLLHIGHIVWARGLFWLMGTHIHVYGREKIVRGKKYIMLINHASIYDIPAIIAVFPRVSWLGRSYLTRIPVFGYFLRRTDYIPIDPGDREKSRIAINNSIAKAESLTIALFPEGTRTITGELGPFKKGFIHIMKATNLDILPVTLNGMFRLKPKTRFIIDPRVRLEAIVSDPITSAELINMSDQEILDRVKTAITANYRL
jgi:1-acyl-sn-glycerol-3-phosphate acyltransferase